MEEGRRYRNTNVAINCSLKIKITSNGNLNVYKHFLSHLTEMLNFLKNLLKRKFNSRTGFREPLGISPCFILRIQLQILKAIPFPSLSI